MVFEYKSLGMDCTSTYCLKDPTIEFRQYSPKRDARLKTKQKIVSSEVEQSQIEVPDGNDL